MTSDRRKLEAWLGDIIVGRLETPYYANPGELKADIRAVLDDLLAAERELEQLREALQRIKNLKADARTGEAERIAATALAGREPGD